MATETVVAGLVVCMLFGFVAGAFTWDVVVGDRLRRQLDRETLRRVKAQVQAATAHHGTPYRHETVRASLAEAQTAATLIALGDNERWSRKAELREAN